MRNLKKVMALALATVMLLGIMVMGAGAADYKAYKDAASVDGKYELAIEMMKEIGVFEGDNNGNLNAKNTLNRAEAAKVIAYLKLTKGVASKIGVATEKPFADVEVDFWAAPYIAYAANVGIVGGVGNNNYDPAGTLTGYQFAKMLLCTLGYKTEEEGYAGNNWETKVNLDALNYGLLKDLDKVDLSLGITREQAIQMAFNALNCKTVTYYGGSAPITLPDGTVIGGTKATLIEGDKLMEDLYEGVYTEGSDKTDINLPTKTWVKNLTTKVAETANYTVVKTYTGDITAVKVSAIYADAGLTATTATSMNIAVNDFENVIGTASVTKTGTATPAKKADDTTTADVDESYNYAGATMKLVKVGTAYTLFIEYNTLGVIGTYVPASGAVKGYFPITGTALKIETTDSKAYAKDDIVSYTVNAAGDKVLTHKKAEIVTGKISEVATNGAVVINGTKYPFAAAAIGGDKSYANDALSAQKTVAFVVENGYIYKSTTPATAVTKASLEGVYYLVAYPTATKDVWGTPTQMAQLVKVATGEVVFEKVENTSAAEEGLYTLTDTDKNGKYTLVEFTGKDSNGTKTIWVSENVKSTALKPTSKTIAVGQVKAYFTSASSILTITGSQDKLAAELKAAPADVDFTASNLQDLKLIYTKNANANDTLEVAMIIFKSAKALVANSTTTYADYFVLNTDKGSVYNAEAKAVYTKMDIIDLKTFEKSEVLVAKIENVEGTPVAFYADGTVNKYGAYEFKGSVPTTAGIASAATLYNNYLTVDMTINGEAVTDYDVTNALVLNPKGIKDVNNAVAITTVAEMVKAGCTFALDTNKTTDTVNYVIVISK